MQASLCWFAAALLLCSRGALAAPVQIADVPLAAQNSGSLVRPNVMFILDDSLSMSWDYLPVTADVDNVCKGVAAFNKIFFDPTADYPPPVRADGTSLANANFSAAYSNGYATSGSVNLGTVSRLSTPTVLVGTTTTTTTSTNSSLCRLGQSSCNLPTPNPTVTTSTSRDGTTTTTVEALYTRTDAPGKTCSTSSNSCTMTISSTTRITSGTYSQFYWATLKPGAANDCKEANYDITYDPATLTAAQKQQYANWYSYYRTRMMAMRAGVGRAFAALDATRFRIGYSTISNTGATDGTEFLNIRNFDSGTQKADFFNKLYNATPSSYTPLRPALEKAGKYFANKVSGQSDPMQYSCQKNVAILSTDGYWNTSDEPRNYTPKLLTDTSTEIGNQDGAATSTPRPMLDNCTPTSNGNGCTGAAGAGVGNTLADIAMYFRKTDIRTPALNNCTVGTENVCTNAPSDKDPNTTEYQNMVTYTVGFGVSGILAYQRDYETATTGDFAAIKQGTKQWPNPVTSTSASLYDDVSVVARIDDLWHAAVNGGGKYFSTNTAQDLAVSLDEALTHINSQPRGGSAAATSSLRPTNGDDWLFFSEYRPGLWEGELKAYKIDVATGAVLSPDAPIWQASTKIKNQGTRNIYFFDSTATNKLTPFTYANLPDAAKANFDSLCAGTPKLTQCTSITTAAKAKVLGANVVDYLRGVATYEFSAATADDQVFRSRNTPLGDIINAAPAYVKKSPFLYSDDGHAAFAASSASRAAMVYVAANDGMLHAINVGSSVTDTAGGTELWAYVPSMVMPNMYRIADSNYETLHRYMVDGSPVVGDVYDATASPPRWRTILVGGLNAGGRGYYALDVTDPAAPQALWEISSTDDAEIGLSFGNPVITKNKAGTWVVAFSSGYNNVSPGSGNGYLFVRNALTGAGLAKIATNNSNGNAVGSTATPSNLGKINAFVDTDTDNTAKRIYGADMLGNVWRFDFDDNILPSGNEAFLLATTGSNQPVTIKPSVSEISVGAAKVALVSVATGRYLGTSDVGDTSLQSIYMFKDDLSTNTLGTLRSNAGMVEQTLNTSRQVATPVAVDWTTQTGWFVDFDQSAGERVTVDMQQQYEQLAVATNVPSPTVCTPGGTSWLYYFDLKTGNVVLTYASLSLTVGLTTVELTTGKSVTYQQGSVDAVPTVRADPDRASVLPGALRRTSWRELLD